MDQYSPLAQQTTKNLCLLLIAIALHFGYTPPIPPPDEDEKLYKGDNDKKKTAFEAAPRASGRVGQVL